MVTIDSIVVPSCTLLLLHMQHIVANSSDTHHICNELHTRRQKSTRPITAVQIPPWDCLKNADIGNYVSKTIYLIFTYILLKPSAVKALSPHIPDGRKCQYGASGTTEYSSHLNSLYQPALNGRNFALNLSVAGYQHTYQ